MIEVVARTDTDWASVWRASPNFGRVTKEIERIVLETKGIKVEDAEEQNEFASTTVRSTSFSAALLSR